MVIWLPKVKVYVPMKLNPYKADRLQLPGLQTAFTQYWPGVGVAQIDTELTPSQVEIAVCNALSAQIASQLEPGGIPFWTMT